MVCGRIASVVQYPEDFFCLIEQRIIERGEVTKLDQRYHERSFAEHKLIQIMEVCYIFEPDERADINELQSLLEDAIAEDERRKESGEPWVYVPHEDDHEDDHEDHHEDDHENHHEDDHNDDDEHHGDEESWSDHESSESESDISDFGGSDSESDVYSEEEESPVLDSPLEDRNLDLEDAEEHFEEEEEHHYEETEEEEEHHYGEEEEEEAHYGEDVEY